MHPWISLLCRRVLKCKLKIELLNWRAGKMFWDPYFTAIPWDHFPQSSNSVRFPILKDAIHKQESSSMQQTNMIYHRDCVIKRYTLSAKVVCQDFLPTQL